MLVALSAIASDPLAPTAKTMAKTLKLLDCVASHPDANITYSARDMVLNINNNASCLTKTKARSLAEGYFPLSDNEKDSKNNKTV